MPVFHKAAEFKVCSASEIRLRQGSAVLTPFGETITEESAVVTVAQIPPKCFTCGAMPSVKACAGCGTVLVCDESCKAEGA